MAITDNLVIWFTCDDNAANTTVTADVGSNGTSSVNTSTLSTTTDALSGNSGGRVFDTANNNGRYVTATLGSTLTDFTISCWVKMDNVTQAGVVANTEPAAGTSGWRLIFASGTVTFRANGTGTTTVSVAASAATMYHIVCKYNNTTKLVSIKVNNGSWTDSGAALTTYTDDSDLTLMNRENDDQRMDGRIQLFGVWSRILSDSEITSLYASGDGLDYPFAVAQNTTDFFAMM